MSSLVVSSIANASGQAFAVPNGISGNIKATTGNLVIGTAGKGIDFDPAGSGAAANLLDDYEEGTWTPTIVGSSSAGTGTYTVQTASYTKVGRQVSVYGRVVISAHTGTGYILLGGLPFTLGTQSYAVGSVLANNLSLAASNYPVIFMANSGSSTIYVNQLPVGGGADTSVPMDAVCDILFSMAYFS
jgi:hypothetical protein